MRVGWFCGFDPLKGKANLMNIDISLFCFNYAYLYLPENTLPSNCTRAFHFKTRLEYLGTQTPLLKC